ncbi:hypothetical protein ACIBI9_52875 [Nonomuraea sp. NPDC050451]|uniref:hypothetical protein n=1 Tax=Nonomuraea sp. NPDC050451 TaxID=3364364 RepID=UPI0037B0600D
MSTTRTNHGFRARSAPSFRVSSCTPLVPPRARNSHGLRKLLCPSTGSPMAAPSAPSSVTTTPVWPIGIVTSFR